MRVLRCIEEIEGFNNSVSFVCCGRDIMVSWVELGREDFSGDDEGCVVRVKVGEEEGECVYDDEICRVV